MKKKIALIMALALSVTTVFCRMWSKGRSEAKREWEWYAEDIYGWV